MDWIIKIGLFAHLYPLHEEHVQAFKSSKD